MQLTVEEERMLDGRFGYPVQKAMEILVQLGHIYGAERMIKLSNVHMPGSSVVVAGEAGTNFVEHMAQLDGHFTGLTTLNPAAVDFSSWSELGYPEAAWQLQTRLTGAYCRMGALPCHTCVPYLIGNAPRIGEHVAWGESSAIAYVNSVLGARTNREGGPSALAAALAGRVPAYGYHLKENRYGQIRIDVNTDLAGVTDYGSLGYWAGGIAGSKVPVFTGIPVNVTQDELKMLSAALASSGAVALFHVVGVTPEAPDLQAAFGGRKPEQVLAFDSRQLQESWSQLNKHQGQEISLVAIGCPHASIREIGTVARFLSGKKISPRLELWITTALPIKALAVRCGYQQPIEDAGGRLVIDTCPILSPMADVAREKGYTALVTNSAKLAHYAPGQWGLPTYYGSLQACLNAALNGNFQQD